MKILIAEDETAMKKIIAAYLQKEGYEVRLASDGEEALEKLYEEHFDLVILDWMMPKMSGIEVCKFMRSNQMDVKTMLLTAKS
ncbi:MAG: response regulator, partial [Cellulosilyticaceae bacterium]